MAVSGTQLLFVYGTLRQGCRNHHLLHGAAFIGRARTQDRFALYLSGIPCVVKGEPVCPIIGEVYQVDHRLLAQLDDHEGHPDWYCRELVAVVLANGASLEAWLYFFGTPEGELVPSGDFTTCPQAKRP